MPHCLKTTRSVLTSLTRPRRAVIPRTLLSCQQHAKLHSTPRRQVVKPYLLADIGEGITQCEIVQWFVQPGARVAEFDLICEVQSDKQATEITSRYAGVIKKLHYEAEDMAFVGKPLLDIDVAEEDAAQLVAQNEEVVQDITKSKRETEGETAVDSAPPTTSSDKSEPTGSTEIIQARSLNANGTLATPAVRHLSKELDIDIAEVRGTGKDGRVLKEDLQNHTSLQQDSTADTPSIPSTTMGEDKVISISGTRGQMFKTMTKSLSIPHFLYTDSIDFTGLNSLRQRLNAHTISPSSDRRTKLSPLPFIIKAVSLAFATYPSLNAHLETHEGSKPTLTYRASHNIGIAIDTPSGLIVPVIHNVQAHTILSLSQEIQRLSQLARTNTLAPADLKGATFSISNIGSIGGGAVAPIIVSPQVAILGVGKARAVPAFGEAGELVRREQAVFSWSADHRVCDGATVARAAELVRSYLENVESMLVGMR